MDDKLKLIETPYIDAQTLLNLFGDYRKPRECILRLVKKGKLIRLKNGFYLIADKIKFGKNTIIPFEQIANLLYGPSYVSFEWALSFYGMIPERVHTITCASLGKNKEYHTPVGDFAYYNLPSDCYSLGIILMEHPDFVGGFLMASREKALVDLVYLRCKGLDKYELKQDLLESKRIDRESLQQLDRNLLKQISEAYKLKRISHLVDLIGII